VQKKTRYWLKWMATGSFATNESIESVDALPHVQDLIWPDRAYAVQAYQRTDIVDGEGNEYKGKEQDVGPLWYHPDSFIRSLEDVRSRNDPDDKILISNMENNQWSHVIYSRWGNWPQPYEAKRMKIAVRRPETVAMDGPYSHRDVVHAIEQFLRYGENTVHKPGGHAGYFSGDGWAARCLRSHLEELRST
jgi:hypothetical protein